MKYQVNVIKVLCRSNEELCGSYLTKKVAHIDLCYDRFKNVPEWNRFRFNHKLAHKNLPIWK